MANLSRNLLRRALHAPTYLYRWGLAGVLGKRFLLLTHIGRRSGVAHQTVLEVMEYRTAGPEAVVMSGFGRNANWLRNIEAGPAPEVVVGNKRFGAEYRFLGDEEAAGVLRRYETQNRLMMPIIRRVLSRLVGWKYTGTDEERRRLVNQLPLIAFRPRTLNGSSGSA